MNKIISVILALSMILMLGACSPKEKEIRGEQIVNDDIQSEDVEDDVENNSEKDDFSLGETNGLAYENSFIGIGCNLGEDWSFYNDEQIKDLNNYAADVAGEDYVEAMKAADIVYDMYAIHDNQLNNINVNLQKVNQIALSQLNLEENFENTIPELEKAFENMGYTDLEFEITTVDVDGEEVMCLKSCGVIDELMMYQKIISIKCDGYLSNITVTTYQEDTVDEVFGKFHYVK